MRTILVHREVASRVSPRKCVYVCVSVWVGGEEGGCMRLIVALDTWWESGGNLSTTTRVGKLGNDRRTTKFSGPGKWSLCRYCNIGRTEVIGVRRRYIRYFGLHSTEPRSTANGWSCSLPELSIDAQNRGRRSFTAAPSWARAMPGLHIVRSKR